MTRLTRCTAQTPGAVAVLQLVGGDVRGVLRRLTGRRDWTPRRACLCSFGGIDEGLALVLADDHAQLMPHGGPRVVQKLIERLTHGLGCAYDPSPAARDLYPEAGSPIEADMLDALARAASPAAIDLLAGQPARWQALVEQGRLSGAQRRAIAEQSRTLDRLLHPSTVVVAGPANAGKSTLTNALMGKPVSIVADLPGTTRDWVGGLVELSADRSAEQAVAVQWLDTPGLRDSGDAVEQRAIALARRQLESADVLIAMRGIDQPWPGDAELTRCPDVWVVNKVDDAPGDQHDDAGASADRPLLISAAKRRGLDRLQRRVIAELGLDRLDAGQPWAFSDTLHRWCAGEATTLEGYLSSV